MSYKINKTNGELLVELIDGEVDNTSSDLTLIGRNYKGFGEFINENNIKLLENFASTSAPGSPLIGQLWYDTAEERLKIYTGDTFRSASGAVVSQTQPNLVTGDIWVDSLNNQMYFYDGADIQLVGPSYNATQKKTGLEAQTIVDDNGSDQTVIYLYVGGILSGIYSSNQFRPRINIVGFPEDPNDVRTPKRQLIQPGFNPVNANFWYRGSATSSRGLVSDSGEEFTEANFMKTDRNTSTTGSISIKNAGGLEIGVSDTVYGVIQVVDSFLTKFEMQEPNKDFVLRVKRSNVFDDVLYAKAQLKRVGIFTDDPQYGLDVNTNGRVTGDWVVDGDLTVNGNTVYINTTNLAIENKTIDLAAENGVAILDDAGVDGGGVVLKSTEGDKTFLYDTASDAWSTNVGINLAAGTSLLFDGVAKITNDALDNSILYARGLVEVGTLVELDVDNINLNGSTITTTDPLFITSTGIITVNAQKIKGVATPVSAKDVIASGGSLVEDDATHVATKGYVDTALSREPVTTSLDLTGLSDPIADFNQNGPYNSAITLLDYLYPASQKAEGTEARVVAMSYTSTTVTGIDVSTGVSKSTVSVFVDPDDSTTPSLETVLSDINFSPVTAAANLAPQRATMDFIVSGGTWSWVRTTVLS